VVQLHGDEGPAYCREVARRTGAKVMKAVRVRDAAQLHDLQRFHTDFHLLDAYSPRTPGGTGETFDWELARRHPGTPPMVLSGGLNPDNVGAAIETARPFAVDVASGTEASPGVKDPIKMKAFAAAVRATTGEPEPAPKAPASEAPKPTAPPAGRRSPVRPTSV
jgi:phosphoribosylanthranilate isomerase